MTIRLGLLNSINLDLIEFKDKITNNNKFPVMILKFIINHEEVSSSMGYRDFLDKGDYSRGDHDVQLMVHA